MSDAQAFIDNLVKTNDVVLFMKDYQDVNVLADEDVRQGIKDYSNWPTIPQLYVKGEFVGGSDIMMEMYQSGELQQVITGQ
eukprot:gene52808-64525_t